MQAQAVGFKPLQTPLPHFPLPKISEKENGELNGDVLAEAVPLSAPKR